MGNLIAFNGNAANDHGRGIFVSAGGGNTLRGNSNWMQARRSQLHSAKFHGGLERLFPIIVPGKSDSAQFDNMVELLFLGEPEASLRVAERAARHASAPARTGCWTAGYWLVRCRLMSPKS